MRKIKASIFHKKYICQYCKAELTIEPIDILGIKTEATDGGYNLWFHCCACGCGNTIDGLIYTEEMKDIICDTTMKQSKEIQMSDGRYTMLISYTKIW